MKSLNTTAFESIFSTYTGTNLAVAIVFKDLGWARFPSLQSSQRRDAIVLSGRR
jgi:hypothetical protein